MHCPTSDGGWKRMAVSDWAGGYTEEFGVALLRGVREAAVTRSASRSSSQVVHHNVSFPTAVHPTPSGEPAVLGPSAATDRTSQNPDAPGVEEATMTHPSIDEESMDEHPNWSDQEIPEDCRRNLMSKTTRKQRKGVRKAHRGLGHPSRPVFVKMLRLAGAHQSAVTRENGCAQFVLRRKCPRHRTLPRRR